MEAELGYASLSRSAISSLQIPAFARLPKSTVDDVYEGSRDRGLHGRG